MFFYGLLDRPRRTPIAKPNEESVAANVGLRRFLALGIGAAVAVALGGLLKRFFCHWHVWLRRSAVQRPEGAKDHADQAGR